MDANEVTPGSVEEHTAWLRIRFGNEDIPYPGGLIPAPVLVRAMSDVTSEISIRMDGNGGLMAAYQDAEFLKPVHVGDYVEIHGRLLQRGNRSRRMRVDMLRSIERVERPDGALIQVIHDPAELVAHMTVVSVNQNR